MRYKRYRFGGWYAPAMWVKDRIYFCAQPVGQASRKYGNSRPMQPSWAVKWEMPSMPRGWSLRACIMS